MPNWTFCPGLWAVGFSPRGWRKWAQVARGWLPSPFGPKSFPGRDITLGASRMALPSPSSAGSSLAVEMGLGWQGPSQCAWWEDGDQLQPAGLQTE